MPFFATGNETAPCAVCGKPFARGDEKTWDRTGDFAGQLKSLRHARGEECGGTSEDAIGFWKAESERAQESQRPAPAPAPRREAALGEAEPHAAEPSLLELQLAASITAAQGGVCCLVCGAPPEAQRKC